MAESPDLDFRPEYGLLIAEVQCPSTPGPQLNIKSPELSTSSSSETELARGDGSQSPPPNCAICLGRCKNKCFTNSCMHQFCFKCLLEWSKVKPECPLCKQTFKAIIHNVKSMDQFEEYLVQQPVSASPVPDVYSPFPIPAHLYPQLPTNINGRMHLYVENPGMTTLDLTGLQFHSSANTSRDAYRSYDRRVMPDAAQLLDMYSQETIQGETGSGSLSQLWRRYVYDRKLYALPMPDITGRLRESSSRFYRDNPSQVHRLMPWINRDIVCLLRNTDHDVSAVMEQINSMLLTCNILSPEFRRRLIPFLGTKTLHFIHELNNFARSPFDMNGYDRVVQYSTNSSDEIVIEFSSTSSAGSDVESVNNDTQQEASTSRRVNRQQTATNTGSSGGGFNLYTTSPMTTLLQASAINLSTHNRGANGDNSEGAATTSTVELVSAPTAERPTNIVLSSTSSDECEFVLEQKPPHLRTPELVSLNSESDSDVIFVQETKTTPMPSGITKWASTNSTRVRRPQRRRTNPNLNAQSFSTSNSDSDTFQYNEATSPKKMKIDNWVEVDVGKETNAGPSAGDPKSSNDDVTNVMTKVKEEFNQGASTSTGLQSRYRGTRPNIPRVQHRRQHYTATSDSDDTDDTDSSATDSYFTTDASHSTSDSDTSWSKSRRSSNKQSLKRSRQQKANATSSSRKSRRQLNSSSKSKRTKSSKSPSAKSSTAGRKKKTAKRSRRKSEKSRTSRRSRRAASRKDYAASEDEGAQEIKEEVHEVTQVMPMGICYPCNYSSPASNENEQSEDDSSNKEEATIKQSRSSTFSSTSSSSTSDSSDTAEETPNVSPTSAVETAATNNNPPAAAEPVADSIASMQSSPAAPVEAVNNPNANMAIYSDTD